MISRSWASSARSTLQKVSGSGADCCQSSSRDSQPGRVGSTRSSSASAAASGVAVAYGLPSATTPASATRCIWRVRTMTSATYPSGVATAVCSDW